MTSIYPIIRSLKLLTFFISVYITSLVFADDKLIDNLEQRIKNGPTLSDLIEYSYMVSPMIKTSQAEWRKSLEQYRVNKAYPDPQFLLTYWPKSVANDLNARKLEAMLSQTIPFPGKLSAAGKLTKTEGTINRFNLDLTVRDLIINIRESFHELCYIREAMRIAKNNQSLLEQIQTISETSYANNRSALIDVMKSQSQSAQSGYDQILLQELEKTEITKLNSLLNRPQGADIGKLADVPYLKVLFSIDDIFSKAEKNREEIKIAITEIEKSEAESKIASFENYPEFMFGLLFETNATDDPDASRENLYGFQFGLTLPLRFDKNFGRIEASKAAVDKAKAMAVTRVNETRAMVRENYFRMQNAERLIILYRDKLVPQSAKSVETASVWNRQGQGSITDYLEAQSVWYNFQLALARSKADYGKYLARLEGLAGQSLTVKDGAKSTQK
ncbi:MAG: TolC family protein [Desulfobacterales bacterium]|nr:TolC family protein [Desulfobacterales bacterium]MBF0397588.1 TolC family protein [Desulfobacterales bacterium]